MTYLQRFRPVKLEVSVKVMSGKEPKQGWNQTQE